MEVVLIDPRTATIPALLAAAKDVLRTSPNVRAAEWAGDLEPVALGVEVHEGRGGGSGEGGEGGKGGKDGKGGFVREKAGNVNVNVNVGRKVAAKAEGVEGGAGEGEYREGKGKREVDGEEKAGRTVKVHEGNLKACLMLLARGGGALVVEFRAGVKGGK